MLKFQKFMSRFRTTTKEPESGTIFWNIDNTRMTTAEGSIIRKTNYPKQGFASTWYTPSSISTIRSN